MQTELTYILRQPKQIDPNKTYPALFLMHGMGSNEEDLLPLVRDFEDSFFVFSIRGPFVQPPGYAFFTIEGFGKPHRKVFDEAVQKLSGFISGACNQYPINRESIYLLGFSQGAILSMTLGLTLGKKIKGVIALSGYLPEFVKHDYKLQDVSHLSIFISHGEMDQVLPYEWGEENSQFFVDKGASVTFKSYPVTHTVSLQNFEDFVRWLKTIHEE